MMTVKCSNEALNVNASSASAEGLGTISSDKVFSTRKHITLASPGIILEVG